MQQWWANSPPTAASPPSIGSPSMSPSQFSSFALQYPSECYPGSPQSPYLARDSSLLSYASFRAASPAHVISNYPNNYGPMDLSFQQKRRPGPVVPQKKYSAPFTAGCAPIVIPFKFMNESHEGVPMSLLRDVSAMDLAIEGGDHTPFDESIATTITLRIWWPGYKQWSRRMTMRKATGLITKCELAMAIAEVYNDWFQSAVLDSDNPEPGLSQWTIGRPGILPNDLLLLRVEQVSQGSWQADVRLTHER